MDNVSEEEFKAVVEIFGRSDWLQLRLELSGLTIELSKQSASAVRATPSRILRGRSLHREKRAVQPEPGSGSIMREPRVPKGWLVVRAPNLGTFRRAPNAGGKPSVDLGQAVKPDTELCLVQVMRLFTSVAAGAQGVVRQICALDGELVEYDQPLFVIEPQGN